MPNEVEKFIDPQAFSDASDKLHSSHDTSMAVQLDAASGLALGDAGVRTFTDHNDDVRIELTWDDDDVTP